MRTVTFKELRIKNFLSIGNEEVTIHFNAGLNIITGVNKDKEDRRNGVGKSAIQDALYFAIFGTTLRELKREFILNNITQDTCEVRLILNVNSHRGHDDFEIIRTLKPSRITIIKNGVDRTLDSIESNNQYISEILSSSPEVFQNCVTLTINNTIPFMAKSKTDKRKFIEQIFNLQVFSAMSAKLKDEQSEVNKSYSIELTKNAEIIRTINTYEQQKVTQIADRTDKIAQVNVKIAANQVNINALIAEKAAHEVIDISSKQENLVKLNKAYDIIDAKIAEFAGTIATAQNSIKHKLVHMKQIGTKDHICPVCIKPIESGDEAKFEAKKREYQSEIDDLQATIVNITAERIKIDATKIDVKKSILKVTDEIHALKLKIESRKALDQRIKDLENIKTQLTESITHLKEVSSFEEYIKEAKNRLEESNKQIEMIKKSVNLLDAVAFVVGPEGIKSYILTKILTNLNATIAHYIKKLDGNSVVIFDEFLEPSFTNNKGKECCYENFSGAEKKAIDLAVTLAFLDMRKGQGDVVYNVLMLDELLDGSFDARAVELATSILQERCDKFKESIFIISHRQEVAKFCIGEIINLEKTNGITRRV